MTPDRVGRSRTPSTPAPGEPLIVSLRSGVPGALTELITLDGALNKRAVDVPAYFELLGTSNGAAEAMRGRLEHLHGSALRFRNLVNDIAGFLLGTGGSRPRLNPRS
ncbi:hypothetical protein NUM3379_22930 [Kineococcus sp. NUM-3379]